jgi:hypothetical protein
MKQFRNRLRSGFPLSLFLSLSLYLLLYRGYPVKILSKGTYVTDRRKYYYTTRKSDDETDAG